VAQLKALTAEYPPALKQALINKYLFEAQFSVDIARKPAHRSDVAYVAGCLFRGVACLVQVLYALNERYFLNEKASADAVDAFPLHPDGFRTSVAQAVAAPSEASVACLEMLVQQVRRLCADVPGLRPAVAFRSVR
jgi:hypothetical protein